MWMRGHRNHVHPSMYPTTDRLINHAPKEHLVDDTPGLYLHIRAGHTWKNLNAGCTTNSSTHECCAHVIEWSSAPFIPSWTRIIVNTCTEALNYHQKVHFIWWKDAYRFISTWLTWCPEPYCYPFHETTQNTVLQNRNACTYSSKVLRKPILKHWTTSRKNIIVRDVKKIMCKLINMSNRRKFPGFLYCTWGWAFGCWFRVQQIRYAASVFHTGFDNPEFW